MKKKAFAELFKKKRAEKDLSFGDLEKQIGVTRGILFRYEKGHSYPSQKVIPKLCEVLGLDPEETFWLINKEKNPESKIVDYCKDPFIILRQALLKAYNPKIFSSQTQASLSDIKSEFAKISPHPIETLLLHMTIKHLEESNEIPKSLHYNMREEAKKKHIEKTGLHWVYDTRIQLLTYIFKNESKLHHVSLKLTEKI